MPADLLIKNSSHHFHAFADWVESQPDFTRSDKAWFEDTATYIQQFGGKYIFDSSKNWLEKITFKTEEDSPYFTLKFN